MKMEMNDKELELQKMELQLQKEKLRIVFIRFFSRVKYQLEAFSEEHLHTQTHTQTVRIFNTHSHSVRAYNTHKQTHTYTQKDTHTA